MTVSEAQFTARLRDANANRPLGLSDGQGRAAGRRFDVYRNNVMVSLIAALEVSFPCLRKLLGPQNFTVLARAFASVHPPSSPLMMFYGAEMPAFLADFAPTQGTAYLPDIARLELAMRSSYHAEDAAALDPAMLQAIPPDRLMQITISMAPAVQLLCSDWPIHAIWCFNMQPGAPKPQMAAQDVLITRPEYDPVPRLLPPGGGAFVAALISGRSLGAALATTQDLHPGFDLAATLSLLISGNAIKTIGDTP